MAIIHLEAGDQIVLDDGLRLIAVPHDYDDANEQAKNDPEPARRSPLKAIAEDSLKDLSVRDFYGVGTAATKDTPDVVKRPAWPAAVKY